MLLGRTLIGSFVLFDTSLQTGALSVELREGSLKSFIGNRLLLLLLDLFDQLFNLDGFSLASIVQDGIL